MTDDQTPGNAFAAALQEFESSGDDSALLSRFADEAELLRPEVGKADASSSSDPAQYWQTYRAQFSDIRTEFTHVHECDTLASLEWSSSGTLGTGRPISYRGVSLLTLDDDGKVSRFATYYDSAAFLEPAE